MNTDKQQLSKNEQNEKKRSQGPPATDYAKAVGNQAAIQRMLSSNYSPYGKDFYTGSDAEKALDEEIMKEDPNWRLMINDLKWRPAYASGQVMAVWNRFKKGKRGGKEYATCVGSPTGEVDWDPDTTRIGVWDMGHIQGGEYWKLISRFKDGKITLGEVILEYQEPMNYQVEDPSYNRSHKGESK